jgi:hypothetical protein
MQSGRACFSKPGGRQHLVNEHRLTRCVKHWKQFSLRENLKRLLTRRTVPTKVGTHLLGAVTIIGAWPG